MAKRDKKKRTKKTTKKAVKKAIREATTALTPHQQGIVMAVQMICRGMERWQIVQTLKEKGLAKSSSTADRRIAQAKAELKEHSDQEIEFHKAESVGMLREVTRQMMNRKQMGWERDKDDVIIKDSQGNPIPRYKEPSAGEYRVAVQAISQKASITGEKIERVEIIDPTQGASVEETIKQAEEFRALREGRASAKKKVKPKPKKKKAKSGTKSAKKKTSSKRQLSGRAKGKPRGLKRA